METKQLRLQCADSHNLEDATFSKIAAFAFMKTDDPDELCRRAYRYERLAWRINDEQAKQALHDMAQELKVRANEIAAAIRKTRRQT